MYITLDNEESLESKVTSLTTDTLYISGTHLINKDDMGFIAEKLGALKILSISNPFKMDDDFNLSKSWKTSKLSLELKSGEIPAYAFAGAPVYKVNCTSMGVKLNEGVFCGCSLLESIYVGYLNLPKHIVSMGARAFEDCTALKSFSKGALTEIKAIPDYAFKNCTDFENQDFSNVEKIGNYAFEGYKGRNLLEFGRIKSIGKCAFKGCSTPLKFVSISRLTSYSFSDYMGEKLDIAGGPDNIAYDIVIDPFAFENCISELYLDVIGRIRENAFKNYKGRKIYIRKSTPPYTFRITIEKRAFDGYDGVLDLDGTISPMDYAFEGYKGCAISGNVSSGVRESGKFAFKNVQASLGFNFICEKWDSIFEDYKYTGILDLSNVEVIDGNDAFKNCESKLKLDHLKIIEKRTFSGYSLLPKVLDFKFVEKIGPESFQNNTVLEKVSFTAQNGLDIDDNAFNGCTSLEEAVIPTVKSMGMGSYSHCHSLKRIVISETGDPPILKEIKAKAFLECSALTSFDFSCISSIGKNAFDSCQTLEKIEAPLLTEIQDEAFNKCVSLKSVQSPALSSLGNGAFNGCTALEIINFPELEIVSDKAFYSCEELHNFSMPKIVTIGEDAFNGCKKISQVDFPLAQIIGFSIEDGPSEKVRVSGVFSGCEYLTTVNLPNAIELAENAFFGCERLKQVNIDCLEKIRQNTFSDCMLLKTIYASKVTEIESAAFFNCISLENVSFNNVTELGVFVFGRCLTLISASLNKVKTLSENTFKDCTALESVSLQSVTKIEFNAFSNCKLLKVLMLGNQVPAFDSDPFIDAETIIKVKVPKGSVEVYKKTAPFNDESRFQIVENEVE